MKKGDTVVLKSDPKWKSLSRYKGWGITPDTYLTIKSIRRISNYDGFGPTNELLFTTGMLAPEFDFTFPSKLHKVLE